MLVSNGLISIFTPTIPILLLVVFGCSTIDSQSRFHSFRLKPGQDLKKEIISYIEKKQIKAAAIITTVGSLTQLKIRMANQRNYSVSNGHFEIVSLVGTLSFPHGSHLHIAVADRNGKTLGGHLGDQNIIYTTAEIVLVELKDRAFKRSYCPLSTYKELDVEIIRQ